MKYSILFPYIERAVQLHNTLISFVHHYHGRDDYEVIIVEDAKNSSEESARLAQLVLLFFNKINISLHLPKIEATNPSMLFNYAAEKSTAEYFIISNPECFHKTDILKGLDDEFE